MSQTWEGALSGLKRFLAAESLLKMMKRAFYFTSKALFVLKIFKFLSWLFGPVAKRFDKKDKVKFKIYDVTAWSINNFTTYTANISRSKGNQTMKFGQLTWETFFLKNHTQNVVEKLVQDPFLKNWNWAYLWIKTLKFYTAFLIACQVAGYRNIIKTSCRPPAFTSY